MFNECFYNVGFNINWTLMCGQCLITLRSMIANFFTSESFEYVECEDLTLYECFANNQTRCWNQMLEPNVYWMVFKCLVDHMLEPNVHSMFDNIKIYDFKFFHICMCCMRETNIEWMFGQR